jgi:predicted DNA-binding protein (UPF0251 family)
MKTLDDVSRELRAEFKALREEVAFLRESLVLPEVLSYEMAAKRLGVSVSTVKRLVKSGAILTVLIEKTPKIPGSEIRRLATPPVPKSAVVKPRRGAMTESAKVRAKYSRR